MTGSRTILNARARVAPTAAAAVGPHRVPRQ